MQKVVWYMNCRRMCATMSYDGSCLLCGRLVECSHFMSVDIYRCDVCMLFFFLFFTLCYMVLCPVL